MRDRILVFGSNLAGRHGLGAARSARLYYGAIYGRGEGLQGSSYAIPTKDEQLITLPLARIVVHVDTFKEFAEHHPDWIFRLTPIGCGLAGYKHAQIGPMFKYSPENIEIPIEFEPYAR